MANLRLPGYQIPDLEPARIGQSGVLCLASQSATIGDARLLGRQELLELLLELGDPLVAGSPLFLAASIRNIVGSEMMP